MQSGKAGNAQDVRGADLISGCGSDLRKCGFTDSESKPAQSGRNLDETPVAAGYEQFIVFGCGDEITPRERLRGGGQFYGYVEPSVGFGKNFCRYAEPAGIAAELGEIRRQQERAPRIQPLRNQFVRECADRLPVPQDQSCLAVRAGRSGEHFETEVYEFLDIQVFHVGVALPEYAVL